MTRNYAVSDDDLIVMAWLMQYMTDANSLSAFNAYLCACNLRAFTYITRSSGTAERQRVSYTRLSRLTHWSCTSL